MANRFLDTAVFYDAGKVTARTSDLDLKGLKSDFGFGVRFHGPFCDAAPHRVWPRVPKVSPLSSPRQRHSEVAAMSYIIVSCRHSAARRR